MRLRLRITSPAGESTSFEHAGPSVRIGRQPGCELELSGAENQSISREHARIDLTSSGAILTDLGSINGTLLNDRRIPAPKLLQKGDRIRLGYTGATITVVDVETGGAPAANGKHAPARLWIAAAAVLALLVVAVILILVAMAALKPGTRKDAGESASAASDPASASAGSTPAVIADVPARAAGGDAAPPRRVEPEVPADEEAEVAVGTYTVRPEWGPSVLLDQRGEGFPRARLRPEARVVTSHTLLCLPGYRAHLQMDSGVELTLWGNVPEFCRVPPLLLESAALLKSAPASAADLDLVLFRGRVHVANSKKQGPARVRLHFLRDVWEVTLTDSSSEFCAELWGMLAPPDDKHTQSVLPPRIGLFSKGRVVLQTSRDKPARELPDHSRVSRVIEPGSSLFRSSAGGLPDWWARPPDAKQPRVADVMLSLMDWSERLREPGDLIQEIYRRTEGHRPRQAASHEDDPTFRSLGVYFLGAFEGDGIPLVVRLLEDPDHPQVRRAAMHVLRAWLARDSRHDAVLTPILQARIDPARRAADVHRLLYPFPADTVADREKWLQASQLLIGFMNDDNVALRDLAAWHLEDLARACGLAEIPYFDAGAAPDARAKVIRDWKRILAAQPAAAQ
jgi:hypothetical protein